MKIHYWAELSNEELELIDDMEILSENTSLHVLEILRLYRGITYRSLYEISTGNLIEHGKFKETIEL